jgi:hypothetical protein
VIQSVLQHRQNPLDFKLNVFKHFDLNGQCSATFSDSYANESAMYIRRTTSFPFYSTSVSTLFITALHHCHSPCVYVFLSRYNVYNAYFATGSNIVIIYNGYCKLLIGLSKEIIFEK